MREMKDSGASWIGCIPSNWDIGRIDGFYTLRNTKVSDKDYLPLSVTMKGVLPQLETAAKTDGTVIGFGSIGTNFSQILIACAAGHHRDGGCEVE